MSTMTKVFVVLNAVLSVALSCFFISAAAQWDNWRQLAIDYQMQRDAEITLRMNTRASMEAALAMKDEALNERGVLVSQLQQQIQDQADKLAKLNSEVVRAQQDAMACDASRTNLEQLLKVATNERTAAQEHNRSLLDQNIDLQSRNTRLNSRVLELTANVAILTEETRNLQAKVLACEREVAEAQRGGVRTVAAEEPAAAGGAEAVRPSVAGKIKGTITEIDGQYASIDIGEAAGVVEGMRFIIDRGGSYVGDLVIASVEPKQAGGKLTMLNGQVSVGDRVVYGLDK